LPTRWTAVLTRRLPRRLASQAYGAGDLKQVGVVLQRGLLVLNLTAIPIWILWFYCEKILLAVGQEAHTSKLAGDFVFYYSPGLPAMLSYEPLKKYLQVWRGEYGSADRSRSAWREY
jgi:MATE family multidrug resistance protein